MTCDSLSPTSSFASSDIAPSNAPPRRRATYQAMGSAHNLVKRLSGRASSLSNVSTSALSSHSRVSGSSDWPVTSARARNTPFSPPALAPATMSLTTRRRSPARPSNSSST